MSKDTGGLAFPITFTVPPGGNKPDGTIAGPNEQFNYVETGMTLRDWFAGQAIPAIIAATSAGQHNPGMKVPQGATIIERMAHDAYELADAMLEARK